MKSEAEWIAEIENCTHRPSLDGILDRASNDGYRMFVKEFGRIIDAKLNKEWELFQIEQGKSYLKQNLK